MTRTPFTEPERQLLTVVIGSVALVVLCVIAAVAP